VAGYREPPTSPRSRPTRGWCSPTATGTWSPGLLLCGQGDQRPRYPLVSQFAAADRVAAALTRMSRSPRSGRSSACAGKWSSSSIRR